MATTWSTAVLPNSGKYNPEMAQTDHETQVQGILVALRYLSREAEGAGLVELAKTLEEAESKCDRGTDRFLAQALYQHQKQSRSAHNALT
jgi:hypothetical protein